MDTPARSLRLLVPLALAAALQLPAHQARAQALETVAGGVGGFFAGLSVTSGLVVLKAHVEEDYVTSALDLIGPIGLPMVFGAMSGAILGATDPDRLGEVALGGTVGFASGGMIGAGIGWLVTDRPEGPWAGAVIGSAAGLLAGAVWGMTTYEDDGPAVDVATVHLPLDLFGR